MNDIDNIPWYQSTAGPQISRTIIGIVGNVLPVLDLLLQGHGFYVLPGSLDTYIAIGVFLWFSARAAFGYVQAKKILSARIQHLEARMGGMTDTRLFYGPYQCEKRCGKTIVAASKEQGGEEYDVPSGGGPYPNSVWKKHVCQK